MGRACADPAISSAGLARDLSDPVAAHHQHQGTVVEVLDGCTLTGREAHAPARAPTTVPPIQRRRVAMRAGERARAAAVLRAQLFSSLPHSDKHGGWPAGAMEHGGAHRRARRRLLSAAG